MVRRGVLMGGGCNGGEDGVRMGWVMWGVLVGCACIAVVRGGGCGWGWDWGCSEGAEQW